MRVVIDTNIVASAVYFGGKPYQFLHLLMEGKIDVVASDEIVKEYDRTLVKLQNKYPKLSKRIPFAEIVAKLEIINVSSDVNRAGWRPIIVNKAHRQRQDGSQNKEFRI